MKRTGYGIIFATLIASTSAIAQTPSWAPPAENQRCPSKWGAGDERGSGNHMKPQTVLNAARLIKTGEVIELGHVLNDKIAIQSTRRFEMFTKRTGEFLGSNRRGSNEELVVSEIGQVGTQFDGFAHQTHENSLYNCFNRDPHRLHQARHPQCRCADDAWRDDRCRRLQGRRYARGRL